MTREDVLRLFPDATDEQITNLLNQNNSEVAREKNKVDKYREKADRVDELEAENEELKNKNLSSEEKAEKELEKANQRIAQLEQNEKISNKKRDVMSKFKITSEQAEQVVKEDGELDVDVLGQIISDKETTAATAKEQEIARDAGNPGGGSASGNGGEEKSNPEKIATKFFKKEKQENNILSHYVGGN